MKIPLEFAELHGPIFIHKKSLPAKLYADGFHKHQTGLTLLYDRDERELLISYKNSEGVFDAVVPQGNIACYWPAKVEAKPVVPEPIEPVIVHKRSAQVSSPTDHVFAGPGHGKTKG